MNRQRSGAPRKPLGLFANGNQRKRKSWTFERLEDRMVFSAQPFDLQSQVPQSVSYSTATAEGARNDNAARNAVGRHSGSRREQPNAGRDYTIRCPTTRCS